MKTHDTFKFNILSLLLACLMAFSAFGCMGSGHEGDTEPPVIVNMAPENQDTDVPVNAHINVVFSKSVINISAQSFYLERVGTFGNVATTVAYDDSTRTATLIPTEALDWDSIYAVTITSEVRSRSGVALEPASWVFITSTEEDSVPPSIEERSPDQSNYVPIDTDIYVVFSERVNKVGKSTFFIKENDTGPPLPATVTYNPDTGKAALSAGTLKEWTIYTVTLTDAITDIAGNSLPLTKWTFTTEDTTDPTIVSRYPEEDQDNVSTNAEISVTFSESMKSYTIHNNSANFKLEKNDAGNWVAVDASVIYNDATRTAVLYPAGELSISTEYQVTLSGEIRDLAHNALTGTLQWTFTTSAISDPTPPEVTLKDPDSGETNVPTNKTIKIVFDEYVRQVGQTSFILERVLDSKKIDGNVVYTQSTRTATFTPLNTLEEGVLYRIRLTGDIEDMNGNALVPISWTFTTADTTIPFVISHHPGDGVANVGVNTNITAVFSESVGDVNAASFTVKNLSTGTKVDGEASYNAATKAATFDPDGNLAYDSEFEVTLTDDIKDDAGNRLNVTKWNFQTGIEPDTTPPTVVSPTYPDHQNPQANVPVSATVSIFFSEPVSGVGPGTVMLYKGDKNGTLVASTVTFDPVAKNAQILPNNYMDYSSVYTVVVKGGPTTEIKDAAGNKVASDIEWSFTTVADTTSPYVTYRTPTPGTPDIPGNAVSVTVFFSEQVENVTKSSFMLTRNFGAHDVVDADVEYHYDAGTNTASATLTPKDNVEATGEYKVVLTDSINDISANKNKLIPISDWTFSITALDEEAPTAVNRVPAPGAVNWINKKVTVIFSEDVKGVSGNSFYVEDESKNKIPASVTYSQGLLTAELVLTGGFEYEKTYTAYLTGAIVDRANNPFSPISWSFSTPADTVAPTVTSVYPPPGQQNFQVNESIYATFSEDIQGYSTSTFYLEPAASANITYDPQEHKLTLTPTSNLAGETTYTVHITTGIKDKAKVPNSLAGEYTWQFKTIEVPDTTPPAIVDGSKSPGKDATGVKLDANVSMQFTEHVVNATSKITLLKGTTPVSAAVSYNPATFVATLNPDDDLIQNTVYTVKVLGGPTGIKDAANNHMENTVEWSFTTEQDTTPPTIIERYPAPGATGVPLKPTVTVKFSEPVTGVSKASFYFTSGVSVYYVLYDEATRTATLTPGGNLANSTQYEVNLTNAIKDRANNSLTAAKWSFTTNALPVVTNIETSSNGKDYTTRADNATGVPHDTKYIRITFNRAMDTQKSWFELYEGASETNTPSPASPGIGEWSDEKNIITYPIVGKFKGGTACQARLYGWGGTFKDPDGNEINKATYLNDGIFNFTTAVDSANPVVVSTIPKDGATNVGRNIGKIVIRFNEMMNQTRGSTITLSPSISATRAGWIDGGRTVVFTFGQLQASTPYTVTLNSGSSNSFRDLSGNNASAPLSFSFTTGSSTGSTTVLDESFEDYTEPNFLYLKNVSNDSGVDWERVTMERAGNGSSINPQHGSYMAKAASWLWEPASYSNVELISPLSFSTQGSYILEFSMFHEQLYNQIDRLEIYGSTDGTNYVPLQGGALDAAFRYDFSLGGPSWKTHYVDLSDYSGHGTVYLRLKAISSGDLGGNVIIDSLKVTRY